MFTLQLQFYVTHAILVIINIINVLFNAITLSTTFVEDNVCVCVCVCVCVSFKRSGSFEHFNTHSQVIYSCVRT